MIFFGGISLFFFGVLLAVISAWRYHSNKKDLEDIEFKLAGEHKASHKSDKSIDIATSNLITAIVFGVLFAVMFIPFTILVASFLQGVPAESFWFLVAFLAINLFFIIVAFLLMKEEIRKYKMAKK